MEENPQAQYASPHQPDPALCVQCQEKPYEPGHAINLCSSCRQALIRYPIPKSIVFFAIGILAVIVVSLLRTQKYISAAVHLGKAEHAIEQRKYLTAQHELIRVLNDFPDDFTANGYLMIASAYNFDYESYNLAFDRVSTRTTEDTSLVNQVNTASEYMGKNFPKDTTLYKRILTYSGNEAKLLSMVDSTKELTLKAHIANLLYDTKNYQAVENICKTILIDDPDFYQSISLLTAVKRNTGKYDEAILYCDKLLSMNREDVQALTQKARVELKWKHDLKAATYINQALELSPNNNSVLESKAMLEYFTGKKKESLATLALIKTQERDTRDSSISTRLSPIINGLEKYR